MDASFLLVFGFRFPAEPVFPLLWYLSAKIMQSITRQPVWHTK
jgi:hypothetical protein